MGRRNGAVEVRRTPVILPELGVVKMNVIRRRIAKEMVQVHDFAI